MIMKPTYDMMTKNNYRYMLTHYLLLHGASDYWLASSCSIVYEIRAFALIVGGYYVKFDGVN